MARRFLYDSSASFGDEAEVFGTPEPICSYDMLPVQRKRTAYLEYVGHSDLDTGQVEGETDAIFSATWELPVTIRKRAFQYQASELDVNEGAFAEVEGQSFFDCGRMPVTRKRRAVRMSHGLETGHTLWVSIGARYGEMRTIMKHLGNMETRPKRFGDVRVAPVQ